VIRWPNRAEVHEAVRKWAEGLSKSRPELVRAGYFGSYARGEWSVGSDVDVVLVVTESTEPFYRRAASYDTMKLPVQADLLVYTSAEWESLRARRPPSPVTKDAVWVYPR